MSGELYVGLMSGTSLDGVDAALVDLSEAKPLLLAQAQAGFDAVLRAELLALNSAGADEIERAARAGITLAGYYAEAVASVLAAARRSPDEVRAIGCHGQTIRHRPAQGFTIQIGNAALLAERTGIRVVSDFRSRDVAAGGQGAPLAPAFHAAVFASAEEDRAVLNLGGIANLTLLPAAGAVTGFDTGPANCLLDLWSARHQGEPFDDGGRWAAGGAVLPALLQRLLGEPYFAAVAPKSTGRDLFNAPWLERALQGGEKPRDVQATLLELTARSIAEALSRHAPRCRRMIVCGGGARNTALLQRLSTLVGPAVVEPSDRHGVDPQLVEAMAFAWLAKRTMDGAAGNLPAVTGARGPRVLGSIAPA